MPAATKKVPVEPLVISRHEAATMLGLSENGLDALLNSGQIEARYSGRRRLVVVASIHEYIANLPTYKD